MPRVATEFSTFLEHYSGYTAYINELQEKYSIENFEMQEVDKQAWIVERFEATDKDTFAIFQTYTNNRKTSSTCQENSWHVEMNNRDFKSKREVA